MIRVYFNSNLVAIFATKEAFDVTESGLKALAEKKGVEMAVGSDGESLQDTRIEGDSAIIHKTRDNVITGVFGDRDVESVCLGSVLDNKEQANG